MKPPAKAAGASEVDPSLLKQLVSLGIQERHARLSLEKAGNDVRSTHLLPPQLPRLSRCDCYSFVAAQLKKAIDYLTSQDLPADMAAEVEPYESDIKQRFQAVVKSWEQGEGPGEGLPLVSEEGKANAVSGSQEGGGGGDAHSSEEAKEGSRASQRPAARLKLEYDLDEDLVAEGLDGKAGTDMALGYGSFHQRYYLDGKLIAGMRRLSCLVE